MVEGVPPAGDIPTLGRVGHDRVVLILLPSHSAVRRVGQALTLGALEVRLGPRGGEFRNGCVECQQSAVRSTGQVDRLGGSGENSEVIVQSRSVVVACQIGSAK